MKKIAAGFIGLAFVLAFSAPAFAVQRGTPEYQKMIEVKKAQREKREAKKAVEKTAVESGTAGPKKPGFWQREAARSGFAGTGAMFGNAVHSVVPLDKPNSRKTQ